MRSSKAVAALLVLAFTSFVCANGLPVLRHDWASIEDRRDFLSSVVAELAWNPQGIGSARPYPTDFLLAFCNTIVTLVVGTHLALIVFAGAIAALVAYGAFSLSARFTDSPWALSGMTAFALFNPWVYTEVVAGHMAMIAAYGATMALVAESLRTPYRPFVAAVCVCAAVAQLQFFLPVALYTAAIAVRKNSKLPMLTALVVALPSIVGIASNFGQVASTPYTLSWQSGQSIAPFEALGLVGYFTKYTRGIALLAAVAVAATGLLAIVGAATFPMRRVVLAFASVATVSWLWTTGSAGPIAPLYVFAITHFPALELFRELYDLLGFVAVAYLALAAMAAKRFAWLGVFSLVPGAILIAAWTISPVSRFWVNAADLPRVEVAAPSNTRVAFEPDLQPMSFHGAGSGLDPDAYARPDGVASLNEMNATYPAVVALRDYTLAGDTAGLRALGVSNVVERPWLVTNARALRSQLAIGAIGQRPSARRSSVLAPVPELGLLRDVPLATNPPVLGSGAVFFGDAAGLRGSGVPVSWATLAAPMPVVPSDRSLLASSDWVDVRQTFVTQPDIGQGIGGVVTTSPDASLVLDPRMLALAWIRGALVGPGGERIAGTTGGYRWIGLPPEANRVRCIGECVVAAQSASIPTEPASRSAPTVEAVPFSAPVPFFATGRLVPQDRVTFLRFETRFDDHWLAIASGTLLPHFRLESALNGWAVPPHREEMGFVLVECVAVLQAAFEALALAWTAGLAVVVLRTKFAF